jgi:hypothetical protein
LFVFLLVNAKALIFPENRDKGRAKVQEDRKIIQLWEWEIAYFRETLVSGIVLGWVECLYHSSNNIQYAASVDVPGFGEPRKSACLCLLLVQYAQQIGIRALGKLEHWKNTFFISLFKVAAFSKFSDLDFNHLRRFLSSIRVRWYKAHRNQSWNEPCRARRSFAWNLLEKLDSAGIQA